MLRQPLSLYTLRTKAPREHNNKSGSISGTESTVYTVSERRQSREHRVSGVDTAFSFTNPVVYCLNVTTAQRLCPASAGKQRAPEWMGLTGEQWPRRASWEQPALGRVLLQLASPMPLLMFLL